MESVKQPWDRRETESAQAYHAFTVYRDLRADRSIDAAYRHVTGVQKGHNRATGRFKAWAADHEWMKRAEAYDAHLEMMARVEMESAATDRHRDSLAEFQDRQRRLSAAAADAAIALLAKASERLRDLDVKEISAGALPSYFRAAASIAESASNSEAQSLAVDELLRAMEGARV